MSTKDFDAVDAAVDQHTRRPTMRKLARAIIKRQEKLRAMVSADAWKAYLTLEAVVSERNSEVVDAAIRLGLRHGRRGRR